MVDISRTSSWGLSWFIDQRSHHSGAPSCSHWKSLPTGKVCHFLNGKSRAMFIINNVFWDISTVSMAMFSILIYILVNQLFLWPCSPSRTVSDYKRAMMASNDGYEWLIRATGWCPPVISWFINTMKTSIN